jgi:hypothetical protein
MALLIGAAKAILHARGAITTTRTRISGGELSDATRERLFRLADEAGIV